MVKGHECRKLRAIHKKQVSKKGKNMNNIRKRVTSVLVAAVTVLSVGAASVEVGTFGLLPDLSISAGAAEGVSYVNAQGAEKVCSDYTKIKSSTTALKGRWYVVSGKVTIDGQLSVTDDSYVILTDGSKLTVKGGISVASGVKFNVYTQADSTGSLYAGTTTGSNTTAANGNPGIGGKGAKINLVGGNIYANGGLNAYGIQGSDIHVYWTNPTDSVYASSYSTDVQLLDGFVNTKNNSTYFENSVSASSLKESRLQAARVIEKNTMELEEGNYISIGNVTASNRLNVSGNVSLYLSNNSTLRADEGITVPRDSALTIFGNTGKLYAGTSNGSNFVADASCAGIGSDNGSKAGDITINGGNIYANGGKNEAGIGGSGAAILITGGTVIANGGSYGAGIGSGSKDNGCDIKIYGGNVTASGGTNAAGIGSGYNSGTSAITLSYTNSSDSIYATSFDGNIKFLKTLYTANGEVATARNINNQKLTSTVTAYTVSFESNGGNYISPISVAANTVIGNRIPTPTKNGYLFDGWYTDRNFYNYFNYNNTRINNNITLYAKWVQNEYTITYDSMGGSYVAPRKVAAGKAIGASAAPTRAGYKFEGWYTDRNCYYLCNIESTLTSDITLYAKWSAEGYTITFESNGGGYVSPMTISAGSVIGAGIPTPRREGYLFDGWYTDKNCTYQFDYMNIKINQNLTLYAGWEKYDTDHTVTFVTNGGTSMSPVKVPDGGTLNQRGLEGTVRSGYTFGGWYRDNGFYNEYSYGEPIYSDLTLYAYWIQDAPETVPVQIFIDNSYIETQNVEIGNPIELHSAYYTYDWYDGVTYIDDIASYRIYEGCTLDAYSRTSVSDTNDNSGNDSTDNNSYYGSTFGGGGLIAAIAGGVVALGGGFAAGMAVGKKKKKDE